jgi:hypothetical protein
MYTYYIIYLFLLQQKYIVVLSNFNEPHKLSEFVCICFTKWFLVHLWNIEFKTNSYKKALPSWNQYYGLINPFYNKIYNILY